jgi:glucose-1-phosphate cytidylyltransferase
MKAVILAGGYGTRISEESAVRPKPMIEIGGRPLLWHIMQRYGAYGVDEFIICAGYKGHIIKEYFANYFLHNADVTFDLRTNSMEVHGHSAEPWRVTVVDTGAQTMTGGRVKRIARYLGDEPCFLTYGDGVSDIDIAALLAFHRSKRVLATMSAVQPPGRFGAFTLEQEQTLVSSFREKPRGDGAWINGGFFVLEPGALNYISGDASVWEQEPMQQLARDGQLAAYKHSGYWQNMDTLRDKMILEEQWQSGRAPWLAREMGV